MAYLNQTYRFFFSFVWTIKRKSPEREYEAILCLSLASLTTTAPLSWPMKIRLLSWWYDMQEHGAKKKKEQERELPWAWRGKTQTRMFLFSHWSNAVLLTGDCVVDAWPVLTAVSFQPYSDGSEGKGRNNTFRALSNVFTRIILQSISSYKKVWHSFRSFTYSPCRPTLQLRRTYTDIKK